MGKFFFEMSSQNILDFEITALIGTEIESMGAMASGRNDF
jgi:hypothetical protein